eukprot:6461927-Amphidinium_carterae.1
MEWVVLFLKHFHCLAIHKHGPAWVISSNRPTSVPCLVLFGNMKTSTSQYFKSGSVMICDINGTWRPSARADPVIEGSR